ncbi:MAG: TIGR03960 family B12-binding radical SAM protein [Nitrospirae bacterium]|nr:TIGR03960 family B12-binding radical SAM protein [Nitrospirota bacterium]
MNLARFRRPSRYINHEVNAIHKKAPIKVALCFPDLYDIGMSHLGLKILYHIVNKLPYASCERVFAPWTDLEEYMRQSGEPLTSLESSTPLHEFDVVGFTLQYELSYTTILNMLSLGKIPIRAEARDASSPLVIGGGPCAMNPYPLLPFFDAFLVGDGEDAIKEIIETVYRYRSGGDGKKESLLRALAEIDGLLVPGYSKPAVKRRYITDLDGADYPTAPPVPYTEVVHDRINIEVTRGCTCGCRFCQAGVIYRPVREREPGTVLGLAEECIKNTGYDEVSFTSLSSGDYSKLPELLRLFNKKFSSRRISFSLPSLRVGSVTEEIVRQIKAVKKTGFTIAPEAATARLRLVINKDFEEEDYERTIAAIFGNGWLNLKLYFMIGLPTETDEDVEAIPAMALKAMKAARKYTNRSVNVSVSVSNFVPKAHTPFQWYGQIPIGEMVRKRDYLKKAVSRKSMKFKGQDERMSLLEAIFARGDESAAILLEAAWKAGARLDPWTELFDYGKWLDAMDDTGIDGEALAARTFERQSSLPWDAIDTGVTKAYLLEELDKSAATDKTPDCRAGCQYCGLGCSGGDYLATTTFLDISDKAVIDVRKPYNPVRVRCTFAKKGALRYLSHLELMTAILKGLRRADVPLVYSQGFSPTPNVAFGQALSVGVVGEREYFDMEVYPPFDLERFKTAVNDSMPADLAVAEMAFIPRELPSLGKFITAYRYEITLKEALNKSNVDDIIKAPGNEWILPILLAFDIIDDKLHLLLADRVEQKVRLSALAEALTGCKMEDLYLVRKAVYGFAGGTVGTFSPGTSNGGGPESGGLKSMELIEPCEITKLTGYSTGSSRKKPVRR